MAPVGPTADQINAGTNAFQKLGFPTIVATGLLTLLVLGVGFTGWKYVDYAIAREARREAAQCKAHDQLCAKLEARDAEIKGLMTGLVEKSNRLMEESIQVQRELKTAVERLTIRHDMAIAD